jgi:predicted nucleotidyltransferase component of viral defense system
LLLDVDDGIEFEFEKIEPIREDDDYNNFRAYFIAHYGKIANLMKVDITTGDEITPREIKYSYRTILDNDKIDVMAYNTETIIAEKYETIIRRNIGTSRARDFYDLYMFYNLYKDSIDVEVLKLAVLKTAKKRDSLEIMSEWEEIIDDMKEDPALKELWNNYCKNNIYASEISYEKVMEITFQISKLLGF